MPAASIAEALLNDLRREDWERGKLGRIADAAAGLPTVERSIEICKVALTIDRWIGPLEIERLWQQNLSQSDILQQHVFPQIATRLEHLENGLWIALRALHARAVGDGSYAKFGEDGSPESRLGALLGVSAYVCKYSKPPCGLDRHQMYLSGSIAGDRR